MQLLCTVTELKRYVTRDKEVVTHKNAAALYIVLMRYVTRDQEVVTHKNETTCDGRQLFGQIVYGDKSNVKSAHCRYPRRKVHRETAGKTHIRVTDDEWLC
jgi:hypothetical protein